MPGFTTLGSSFRSKEFLLILGIASLLGLTSTSVSAQQFIRGDSNADGNVDIGDPIFTLGFLFSGGSGPICESAWDANDDGAIDIADPIRALAYLFSGGAPLAAPFPACGTDPTGDGLTCTVYAPCGTFPPPPTPPILDPHDPGTTAATITIGGLSNGVTVRVASPLLVFEVPVSAGAFVATDIPLAPNSVNTLFFASVDPFGITSNQVATVVVQDSTPPQVVITNPTDGATVTTESVVVSGLVQDLLSDLDGVTLLINGNPVIPTPATGGFGSFTLEVGPLTPAEANAITVEASDALGNSASQTIEVTYLVPSGPRLELLSGSGQTGVIQSELPDPLVYFVSQPDGSPFPNKLVQVVVSGSDGRLRLVPGGPEQISRSILSDAQGLVTTYWRLGNGTGVSAQSVTATSSGIEDVITTFAIATPAPPDKISVATGNSQILQTSGEAPAPLVARVTDSGGNPIAGVPVTFTAQNGGALVRSASGAPSNEVTVTSNAFGQAQAFATLGPSAGNFQVSADFAGNPTLAADFNLFGVASEPGQPTRFEGIALTNASEPIEGAEVTLTFTETVSYSTVTGPQGCFLFNTVGESGPAKLSVDGLNATGVAGQTVPIGSFPCLEFQVVVVPSALNELGMPALLPPLNPLNAVPWDGGIQDLFLTMEEVPGVVMKIAAGTTILDEHGDALQLGAPIALNPVHFDKIPMPLPNGSYSPFAWTLQPGGMQFDPPVEVTLPNFSGIPGGAVVDMVSFNHSTHRFESFGPGTVSQDGRTISSDPGFGIVISGWGAPLPPPPPPAEVHNCAGDALWTLAKDALRLVADLGLALTRVNSAIQCASGLVNSATGVVDAWNTIKADGNLEPGEITTVLNLISTVKTTVLDCADALTQANPGPLASQAQQISNAIGAAIAFAQAENCLGLAGGAALNAAALLNTWVGKILSLVAAVDVKEAALAAACGQIDTISAAITLAGSVPFGPPPTIAEIDAMFAVLQGDLAAAEAADADLQPIVDDAPELITLEADMAATRADLEKNPEIAGATVSIGGQTVIANEGGGFNIGNIPSGGANSRVEVVLEDGGPPQFGQSDCFQLVANEQRLIPPITLGTQPIDVVSISVSVVPPTVEVGTTGQVIVEATLTDGSTVDVTTSNCVTYTRSITNYSTFDPTTGVLTSVLPGTFFLTALYEGAVSGTSVVNTLTIPPTTDVIGFVQLSNGSPVSSATVTIQPSGTATTTDGTGFFFFDDLLANQGDFVIDVNAGAAVSGPIAPVEDGITDAGIFYISSGTELFVTGATGSVGSTVTTNVVLDTDTELSGWSLGICNDVALLEATAAWSGSTTTTIGEDGDPPDFEDVVVLADGVTQGVLISITGAATLPVGFSYTIFTAQYLLGATPGMIPLCLCDTAGVPPVETVLVNTGGTTISVGQNCGNVTINP